MSAVTNLKQLPGNRGGYYTYSTLLQLYMTTLSMNSRKLQALVEDGVPLSLEEIHYRTAEGLRQGLKDNPGFRTITFLDTFSPNLVMDSQKLTKSLEEKHPFKNPSQLLELGKQWKQIKACVDALTSPSRKAGQKVYPESEDVYSQSCRDTYEVFFRCMQITDNRALKIALEKILGDLASGNAAPEKHYFREEVLKNAASVPPGILKHIRGELPTGPQAPLSNSEFFYAAYMKPVSTLATLGKGPKTKKRIENELKKFSEKFYLDFLTTAIANAVPIPLLIDPLYTLCLVKRWDNLLGRYGFLDHEGPGKSDLSA